MRKIFIFLIFSLLVGHPAFSQCPVYYINMQKIINESAKGRQAKSILESKVSEIKEKLKRMRQEIDSLKKELSSPVLTDKARTEKENLLQQKIRDLQRFQQDSRMDMMNLERQYTSQIINDVLRVVENYRKEKNIPLILEKNTSGIVSADPHYDLTDIIIKLYDKEVK